jgi:hypothetical protein
MTAVELYLVIGNSELNRLPVGASLDTIPDVVEATREYVRGPLRESYPALYTFTEFGLQAIESFMIAIVGDAHYTAKIGVADLSDVPVTDRALAAQLAGNFVTALRIASGRREEKALKLLDTDYSGDWERASFEVEPGEWLIRHLRGGNDSSITPLQA